MKGLVLWRSGWVIVLSMAVAVALNGIATMLPGARTPTAEATVAAGKNDDGKDKKDKKNQDSDDADRKLNGQVLEIDTLKDPPELVLGTVDGQTVIRVLKTDEIAINGVRLGDYVEADGEKISEQLFEASQLSVSERYKAPSDDGTDTDKKDKSDKNDEKEKKDKKK